MHNAAMFTALLIDDEPEARRSLGFLISKHCPELRILGQASGVEEGKSLISQLEPDIVFLDIEMQDGTGFDLLQSFLRPSFRVIFVTAYDQYAIRAFEFNALDYLLKPIDIFRLVDAVKKVQHYSGDSYFSQIASLLDNIRSMQFETIILQTQEGQHYIRLENIIRLNSDKNYTSFFCVGRKEIIVSESIKRYERLLPQDRFFRTHQSHIVQRRFVRSYLKESGGYIEMTDGYQVPVSRRKKDAFFAWMRETRH